MRRRGDNDEPRVESLIGEMAEGIAPPTDDELRRHAREAAVPREPQPRPAPGGRPWRPVRFRWALAVAGLLLAATGLGFGVGAQLTPSGSAHPAQTGLGFLPAKGWTILQAGTTGAAASASAVAANVPLDPADHVGETPTHTLRSLPRDGVVIAVTLTTRGDPATDRAYPLRAQPLRFADARIESQVGELVASERRLTRYGLRAGVGGYNVDAQIVFGGRPPSVSALEAADAQLARLVVAPDQLTLSIRPLVNPVSASGTVSTGRPGQKVTVQFRQCGLLPHQFRDVVEVTSVDGGGWETPIGAPTNGVFRAVSSESQSDEVVVKERADIRLTPHGGKRYEIDVVASLPFWRKQALLQRFDRTHQRWKTFRKLVLTEQFGQGLIWSTTKRFTVDLPRRTSIRAVLPLDQARPCFIAGYSNILVT